MNFSGIKVEIKSSWLNPEKIRKLIIIGEKKMLLFDEMAKKDKINSQKLKLIELYVPWNKNKKGKKLIIFGSLSFMTSLKIKRTKTTDKNIESKKKFVSFNELSKFFIWFK